MTAAHGGNKPHATEESHGADGEIPTKSFGTGDGIKGVGDITKIAIAFVLVVLIASFLWEVFFSRPAQQAHVEVGQQAIVQQALPPAGPPPAPAKWDEYDPGLTEWGDPVPIPPRHWVYVYPDPNTGLVLEQCFVGGRYIDWTPQACLDSTLLRFKAPMVDGEPKPTKVRVGFAPM